MSNCGLEVSQGIDERHQHRPCHVKSETRPQLVVWLLDCRPPLLVRVAPEDGRMLTTSAQKADVCATLLVADTDFHTKGTGTVTAVCSCMTSDHKWPSLESSLSRPVLPLLDQAPNASARCTRRGACAAGPVVVRAILQGGDQ